MSSHPGGIGDAPITSEYREMMNDLAHTLDQIFNGDAKKGDRKTGFVLMVFPFGEGGRCNYISNADRADVLATLKDQVARFEGRAVDHVGHG